MFIKSVDSIVNRKNKETLSSPGRFGFLTEPAQDVLLILNFTINFDKSRNLLYIVLKRKKLRVKLPLFRQISQFPIKFRGFTPLMMSQQQVKTFLAAPLLSIIKTLTLNMC